MTQAMQLSESFHLNIDNITSPLTAKFVMLFLITFNFDSMMLKKTYRENPVLVHVFPLSSFVSQMSHLV